MNMSMFVVKPHYLSIPTRNSIYLVDIILSLTVQLSQILKFKIMIPNF